MENKFIEFQLVGRGKVIISANSVVAVAKHDNASLKIITTNGEYIVVGDYDSSIGFFDIIKRA